MGDFLNTIMPLAACCVRPMVNKPCLLLYDMGLSGTKQALTDPKPPLQRHQSTPTLIPSTFCRGCHQSTPTLGSWPHPGCVQFPQGLCNQWSACRWEAHNNEWQGTCQRLWRTLSGWVRVATARFC